MRERTLDEIAKDVGAGGLPPAVGARTAGPDVVIDSRLATPGALFVALPGERVDGHDFAVSAAARGAVAALCTRPVAGELVSIVVPDTALALADLARAVVADERARGLRCVAITGSSGKTSTKDLIAQVLAVAGDTVSPPGSLNNEIGVPLTALRVDATTSYLVSEMGARGQGHIAWLCSIVPPDVAVVINVGHAHLGEFGSVAGIARAKGELAEAASPAGWTVLNADDAEVAAMAARTRAQVAFFSAAKEPAVGELRVWATDIEADDRQRHSFTLHAAGVRAGSAPVTLLGAGRHQVANALAAATVGLAVGLEPDVVAAALCSATARSKWRMELHERPDGVLIVNDTYNANPDSMTAALTTVAGLRRAGGRLVAVLGDMLELGPEGPQAHREIGALAARLGFEVVAIGTLGEQLAAGAAAAGGRSVHVADVDAAVDLVGAGLAPGDVAVVKASRGLALDRVADRLVEDATKGGGAE